MELRRIAVCQDCLAILRRPQNAPKLRQLAPVAQTARRAFATVQTALRSTAYTSQTARIRQIRRLATDSRRPAATQSLDLSVAHSRIQELVSSVLRPEDGKLPSEQRVLYVLEQLEALAKVIVDEKGPEGGLKPEVSTKSQQETATSALLGSVNARRYPAFISKASILDLISEKAEEIARHPDVFIAPAILKAYVELQNLLDQPSSFPDVFDLYARKPVPTSRGASEVEYTAASPDKINAAIDSKTANIALDAAIKSHNLPLAIDIITTSFSSPAFKKAKTLRQAAIPMTGLGLAPIAAYTLSSSFSSLQQTMDPSTATGIAFAGIMTYVGAVSMVGYVAVTTANDQMERVTWASGVPLWERWIREEERAAIDKVAGAWGFREIEKRGEEEGEDWESLREWVGVRGMVLDKVSLMEGME
ncbi:hypothetical protein DOTSEDRAFT_68625 [Dothistroma septosporum NZE10]|uniref:Uncharacterized protein n=1 Tax=Dothistroma septosporum (strain NZE10 / CBS 128990) TaxID=675120 RepID=N1Q298_DOTSN|nr:hypothetical protein DOTSEDRAFT_68625 [Dothistroma septosporum NZE10]